MGYVGTYFGMGSGKVLVTILFMNIGLFIALNRKIIPLSVVFLFIYLGSLFSKGNGKIYTIILCFWLGLFVSKKFSTYFFKSKKNMILKFFI